MHKLNVLILGPSSFISTLNELRDYLKFNLLSNKPNSNSDIIFFHTEALKEKNTKIILNNNNSIKICAGKKKDKITNYDAYLELPTTLREINLLIERTAAKQKFNMNSSIQIKSYLLDKNEKKLSKLKDFVILTEKEILLLELFLQHQEPISKNKILSTVWNYSPDADTHTVETHIYRLRKKISEKFTDEKFILNNKEGYFL